VTTPPYNRVAVVQRKLGDYESLKSADDKLNSTCWLSYVSERHKQSARA